MTEVARALLLPDLIPPSRSTLLTSLLLWEDIQVANDPMTEDERDLAVLQRLDDEGAVRWFQPERPFRPPKNPDQDRIAAAIKAGALPSETAIRVVRQMSDQSADRLADNQIVRLRAAWLRCANLGLAPVAGELLSNFGSLLPPRTAEAPHREAAMISAAVSSIAIDSETPVDQLLEFRTSHRREIGRFRAAMIDLAQEIQHEATPSRIVEEAQAIVVNRVEPALGDLDAALREGKIRFVWRALLGVSGVALGPVTPIAATRGAGQFITHSLSYAFDRDRLVREHPYGYIQRMSHKFGAPEEQEMMAKPFVIEDPAKTIHDLLRRLLGTVNDYYLKQTLGEPLPPAPWDSPAGGGL